MSKLQNLKERYEELDKTHEEYLSKIDQIVKAKKSLEEEIETLELSEIAPNLEWIMNLDYFNLGSLKYKAVQKVLGELNFKHLCQSGGWNETNQIAFKINLEKNADLEDAELEVEKVLPLIKPFEGKKWFGVFEHTLSEYGSYHVWFYSDKIELARTSYGHTEVLKTFTEIADLLAYIKENHYY